MQCVCVCVCVNKNAEFINITSGGAHIYHGGPKRLNILFPKLGKTNFISFAYRYQGCPEVSNHFEYLENRSRGRDVLRQLVRGYLTVHP